MGHTQSGMYVIYASIVLYSICFMMQQPLLPYLTKELGASTAQFATLQSIFNGAQAVGGLLSGESGAHASSPLPQTPFRRR